MKKITTTIVAAGMFISGSLLTGCNTVKDGAYGAEQDVRVVGHTVGRVVEPVGQTVGRVVEPVVQTVTRHRTTVKHAHHSTHAKKHVTKKPAHKHVTKHAKKKTTTTVTHSDQNTPTVEQKTTTESNSSY